MSKIKSQSDLVVEALIKARNNKRLSQRELADSLGITQSKLAAIENRKRTLTFDVAAMIAKALDVDLGSIISPVTSQHMETKKALHEDAIRLFHELSLRDKDAVAALIRHLRRRPAERYDLPVAYSEAEEEERRQQREEKLAKIAASQQTEDD